MSRFEILNAINVSDRIEKKGNLSYLSWVYAWGELKKKYPDSYYTIYEAANGCFYHTDGKTCWVKTGVTLVDGDYQLEHIEYLPVMDARNRSLPLDQVDSYAVNKTIQRSLTKAIARHGLGLYVYAGEDLPEDEQKGNKPEQMQQTGNQPTANVPPPIICVSCHKPIPSVKDRTPQQVAEYTVRNAGAAMCWSCFKHWKEENG